MKTPMWFVKAVGLDANGAIKAQILLTPPMSEEDAQYYHSFVAIFKHGGNLRIAIESNLFFCDKDITEVAYITFETTLY